MGRKRIYLCGRMTHAKGKDFGKAQFTKAAADYRAEGFEVFSPYEESVQVRRNRSDALRFDIQVMLDEIDILSRYRDGD